MTAKRERNASDGHLPELQDVEILAHIDRDGQRWIVVRFPEGWGSSDLPEIEVRGKRNGVALGMIHWYGPWRQYVFYPTVETQTLLNRGCLRDIADFCQAVHKVRAAA